MAKLSNRKSGNRCPGCRMLLSLCFCQKIPRFELLKGDVVLAIHYREARHTTNSGLLAAQVFSPSHVNVRGLMPEHSADENKKFETLIAADSQTSHLVLFPHETALPLLPDHSYRNYRLWAPDGNWKQGKKIANRLLQQVPGAVAVTLPFESLSTYQLRRESHPEKMSTFEAISRALSILEGNPSLKNESDRIFQLMVHRALYSRGLITQAELESQDQKFLEALDPSKTQV